MAVIDHEAELARAAKIHLLINNGQCSLPMASLIRGI